MSSRFNRLFQKHKTDHELITRHIKHVEHRCIPIAHEQWIDKYVEIRNIESFLIRYLARLQRFRNTYDRVISIEHNIKNELIRYIFDAKKYISIYKKEIPSIQEAMADSNHL